MTKTILPLVQQKIDEYKNLHFDKNLVCTPYYINATKHKDLRVMVGKGTPEEIIMEAKIWAKIKGFNLETSSPAEIKKFLEEKGIGIDCSGFIIHVMNELVKVQRPSPIWNFIKVKNKGFLGGLKFKLRPVENIGAETITNEINADKIEIKDVLPGDLIRSKAKKNNGHHIMLVTEVEYDHNHLPTKITYTHSSPYYGELNGIKTGEIKITDISKPLQDQEWFEKDSEGVNHTFEGFMVNVSDNGLRRLKVME
jgi:hypothetical protein